MTPLVSFWITAGLLAVAGAMYRMGSIVRQGKDAAESNAREIAQVKEDLYEHRRDVAAAFRECDERFMAHDRRLGICEERGGAISRLIEKVARIERIQEGMTAVCAERHENSLRIELDERGIDTGGIPRRRK